MKIGVVTTQYASNYGALLQTYAMQRYLNNISSVDSEVLAYYPEHYKEYWKLMPQINGIKDAVILFLCLMTPWRVIGIKNRYKKMNEFIKRYIPCSKPYYSKEEIEAETCPYDVLICGSDQIWNVARHRKLQEVWFLGLSGNGWENAKRIAYAPSVADPIPKERKIEIKDKLGCFSSVSVREVSDVEEIGRLYPGKVYHVCDPVFLLSAQQWMEIEEKPRMDEPYILCYFLNPSKEAADIVRKVKKMTNLKVVQIDINRYNKIPTDLDILSASPTEFIGWINHAEYVITNSFHCTAFSVLFQKNLLVVKKKTANSRMESLLGLIGQSSKMVSLEDLNGFTYDDLKTDYQSGQDIFASFVLQSKKYLLNALGVCHDCD